MQFLFQIFIKFFKFVFFFLICLIYVRIFRPNIFHKTLPFGLAQITFCFKSLIITVFFLVFIHNITIL
uniref:Uncharacterized protein n=1 Tax=Panstrongylus lignarius TaxID=156445 RepID=A0A224XY98_9HEMI